MKPRGYLIVSGVIFLVVAIMHLMRLISGWEITCDGSMVPMWISYAGLPLAGLLSIWAFRLARNN
jgi:uncharacterized membrane protein